MNKNIFVALDFDNLDLALETTKKIRDEIAGVKVGTELYTICGNEGLKKIKEISFSMKVELFVVTKIYLFQSWHFHVGKIVFLYHPRAIIKLLKFIGIKAS